MYEIGVEVAVNKVEKVTAGVICANSLNATPPPKLVYGV